MPTLFRSALLGALSLIPAGALAQGLVELVPPGQDTTVIVEEPLVIEEPIIVQEPPLVVQEPVIVQRPVVVQEQVIIQDSGGIYEEDVRDIAMMNGMVEIDEIDENWRGNYEVDGTDASGDDLEITIDAETGAVLDIDD